VLVQKSQQGALLVERKNPAISVEAIDLRSLAPFDWKKTNRVIIAHEDCLSFGYAAGIAARSFSRLSGV
jgi:2-oxoisovalerate dehydrogenase E1 component